MRKKSEDKKTPFPGYDLFLKSVISFNTLDTSKLEEKPYLIRDDQGKYQIWGYKGNRWQRTDIGDLKIDFEWRLATTVFISPNSKIFNTLRKGHTHPLSLREVSRNAVVKQGLFTLIKKNGLLPKNMLGHDAIKPILRQFFQALIDDDSDTIKKILTRNPELLAYKPEHLEIQSQLTWQRFKAELPLVMALKRNQVKTVELLLPYFEELEGGISEALRQWKVAEDGMLAAKKRSERFDFKSLIDVIAQEDFPNGTDITAKLSDETEQAFATFRAAVLPKQAVALSDYYDIDELLEAAFNAYDKNFNTFKGGHAWDQRSVYCVKVIGFIQGLLTRKDAEVWCQGLNGVVEFGKKIDACALKLLNDVAFYRDSFDSLKGLGIEYWLAGRGVRWGGKLACRWPGPPVVDGKNYAEQKRQNLEALRNSCLLTFRSSVYF